MTARTPSNLVPLAAQSREEPLPYSAPAKTTSGTPSCSYFIAASKIGISSPSGQCLVRPPSGTKTVALLQDEILNSDVGEGSAHHDLMIAAPRAILIEIGFRDLPFEQILAGGRGLLDRAGGRNMVGRDLVAEQRQECGRSQCPGPAPAPFSARRNRAGFAHRSSRCPICRFRPRAPSPCANGCHR